MYESFCLLASALELPSWEGYHRQRFLKGVLLRMHTKASLLKSLLPGLTLANSRDAISRASVMLELEAAQTGGRGALVAKVIAHGARFYRTRATVAQTLFSFDVPGPTPRRVMLLPRRRRH